MRVGKSRIGKLGKLGGKDAPPEANVGELPPAHPKFFLGTLIQRPSHQRSYKIESRARGAGGEDGKKETRLEKGKGETRNRSAGNGKATLKTLAPEPRVMTFEKIRGRQLRRGRRKGRNREKRKGDGEKARGILFRELLPIVLREFVIRSSALQLSMVGEKAVRSIARERGQGKGRRVQTMGGDKEGAGGRWRLALQAAAKAYKKVRIALAGVSRGRSLEKPVQQEKFKRLARAIHKKEGEKEEGGETSKEWCPCCARRRADIGEEDRSEGQRRGSPWGTKIGGGFTISSAARRKGRIVHLRDIRKEKE